MIGIKMYMFAAQWIKTGQNSKTGKIKGNNLLHCLEYIHEALFI